MTKHLRLLYIKAHIDGKAVSIVLVDNGAAVNILPLRMVRRLSKSEQDLIPSEVLRNGIFPCKGKLTNRFMYLRSSGIRRFCLTNIGKGSRLLLKRIELIKTFPERSERKRL